MKASQQGGNLSLISPCSATKMWFSLVVPYHLVQVGNQKHWKKSVLVASEAFLTSSSWGDSSYLALRLSFSNLWLWEQHC